VGTHPLKAKEEMNKARKVEIFYAWLDTPQENQVPKFKSYLARQLKVTTNTLRNWEIERQKTSIPVLKEAAEMLGEQLENAYPRDEVKEVLDNLLKLSKSNAFAGKVFLQAKGALIEKSTKGEI